MKTYYNHVSIRPNCTLSDLIDIENSDHRPVVFYTLDLDWRIVHKFADFGLVKSPTSEIMLFRIQINFEKETYQATVKYTGC